MEEEQRYYTVLFKYIVYVEAKNPEEAHNKAFSEFCSDFGVSQCDIWEISKEDMPDNK